MQVVQDGINAAHEHPKSVLCLGVCVSTEMKKCILFIRFYSCTMLCGWNCIRVREAKKEAERSLICTRQQGWGKGRKKKSH